jgi:hypothetical protein
LEYLLHSFGGQSFTFLCLAEARISALQFPAYSSPPALVHLLKELPE